ncbi:unnamed protein product [Calicophoron daubneyi]|uniref:Coiled-coil domain-containing protein 153 n=1 Tax=Calicophoron daubneyi TaxID=300641 RepID=A0AAV2TLN8_CALDB
MSKKVGTRRKGKSAKKKADPLSEALEKSQKDVRNLRDQLSRTILIGETTENRRYAAQLDRIKSAKTLEDFRNDTKQHTAFLVTQHEMIVSNLNKKVDKLEQSLRALNEKIQEKDEELEKLKADYSENLAQRDSKIDKLRTQLNTQGAKYEDAMVQSFNRLTNTLAEDFVKAHSNFQPWSDGTLKMAELEFLRPPYFDEESTEYC